MKTYHIHITGIVQGVGFRPFVYQLATLKELSGWVKNGNDGVHIEISAEEKQASAFATEVVENAPALSTILSHSIREIAFREYEGFEIIESSEEAGANLPLTPDFALCEDCRKDIRNQNDRRNDYSFTTCTNCGPRYSIIRRMPYDRPKTTMAPFEQCPNCSREYNDPLNRRHFSQTNSCHSCGIEMFVSAETVDVKFIVEQLKTGKIIAIKGIGGYLLVADAGNPETIKLLRERKHRPTKPFAVMYPNLAMVDAEFYLNESARQFLGNEVSPIVLLRPKSDETSVHKETLAPGLNKIGVMIPYAPLFQLILDRYKKPVIATSGNISGSPIIYTNEEAEAELRKIADTIITNNRDIVIPQDDSVVSYASDHQIILRRSRGLAPAMLNHQLQLPRKAILAMGADMKAAFALTHNDYLYVSQFLGDMDSYLTQDYFEKTLNHLQTVLGHQPEAILFDKHPGYFSTKLGNGISEQRQIPKFQIQHHKAHFYAVLAENKLLESKDPVMGIIWDGTGYGDDGMIWGGEFFTYNGVEMRRSAHLPYFPFILGDKMPREPRLSLLSIGNSLSETMPKISQKFTEGEWSLYQPMLADSTLQTSSMGRLFDAVASLVLNIDKISFEGEAAMMLEAAASEISISSIVNDYIFPLETFQQDLFSAILTDIKSGTSPSAIALKFHYSLVNLIKQEADKRAVKKLAFSGGVFQNSLLIELILTELETDFDLYFHKQLSPNDENISYGQIAWHTMHEKELGK